MHQASVHLWHLQLAIWVSPVVLGNDESIGVSAVIITVCQKGHHSEAEDGVDNQAGCEDYGMFMCLFLGLRLRMEMCLVSQAKEKVIMVKYCHATSMAQSLD